MPVDDSAGQSPLGDPDQGDSNRGTSGQSGSDRGAAGNAAPGFRAGPAETGDGADGGAARGVRLTASTWVPEDLVEALRRCEPGSEGNAAAAAFCQGGPLDELPPGPALAAFLADASGLAEAPGLTEASKPTKATGLAEKLGLTEAPSAVEAPGLSRAPDAVEVPELSRAPDAVEVPELAEGAGLADMPGLAGAPGQAEGAGPAETSDSARTDGTSKLARYGDNALLGLIRGWRRIASQAAAAELAAVAEFSERRQAEAKTAGLWDSTAVNAADDELAAALTMTSRSTQLLIDRASALRQLPATAQALAAGKIDMPKTLVFINGLAGQDPALARAIEARLIERAPALTTGQLRAALNRDLLAADPEAAERRRQTEEKQARVERCPEQGGVTASLSGRNLPVPATVAAWNHVTAVARGLRRSGASGTLDELRVLVYLGLLSGQAASDLTAVAAGTEGGARPGETDVDDGSGPGQAATSADRAGGTGTQGARGSSAAPGTQAAGGTGTRRAGGTGTRRAGPADAEGDGTGAADRGGRAEVRPEAEVRPATGAEPATGARQQ